MVDLISQFPVKVRRKHQQRSGIGLHRETESVIDQRLMHGTQDDRFLTRRQPLDVPEIQLPGEPGRLVNHPDLLQVRANRPPDGRGTGV